MGNCLEKVDESKIMYYSVSIQKNMWRKYYFLSDPQISRIIEKYPNIKLNSEFHSTLLFTNGKDNTKSLELIQLLNTLCLVTVKSIAISSDFIVLGVSSITDKNGNPIPYFGNPIMHITIAVRNGCKAKDSPSAFTEGVGHVHIFNKPKIFNCKLIANKIK